MACKYEAYNHHCELLEKEIENFPSGAYKKENVHKFFKELSPKVKECNDKLRKSYSETYSKKFKSYFSVAIPFAPIDETNKLSNEVKYIVKKLTSPMTSDTDYKQYVKTDVLPKYKTLLKETKEKMDMIHESIDNMQ